MKMLLTTTLCLLVASLAVPANAANDASTSPGCTTDEDTCEFECAANDVLFVSVTGAAADAVDGDATCGGGAAKCSGTGACTLVGVAFVRDATGVCTKHAGTTISCASNLAAFALSLLRSAT